MNRWYDTHRGVVHAWMCDHFGHMNARFYAHVFDDASFAMWSMAGVSRDVFARVGLHTVVARTETDLRAELLAGQLLAVRSRFVEIGSKSVTYEQELRDPETGVIHAVQRGVEVFFSPATRESARVPDEVRTILGADGTGA